MSDPAILSSILNLKGEPVAWNGYGSASPFGSFNYPHNGDWRGMVWLISGANRYQLWLWWSSTARPDRVLAFLFWDMEWTDEAYNGQHHFCMASVAASDWEQIEAAIQ